MSAVRLGSNISSIIAQRRLSDGTSQLSKTFERLSSGQRINRAADDAAGLAISESLKSDRRVFNQGVRNFNDGISLLVIADGAIESLSSIVIRLKELAEQSANGTYSSTQRKALDAEAQALSKEYTRIIHSTKFNGVHLLDGSLGNGIRLQGGFGTDGSILSGLGGAIGTGTFNPAVSLINNGDGVYSVALGDLNGDGILDMVGSRDGGSNLVRLGNGDGTFGEATSYSGGWRSITLGDVNNDGILDMVSNAGWATVRLGNGNGTFGDSTSFQTEDLASVTLADLNGDGNLDLISSGERLGIGRISIRLGSGDGSFAAAVTYQMHSQTTTATAVGDLNGDGILDIVSSGNDGTAVLRFGNGDGTFGAAFSYQMEAFSYDIKLEDLNGDGILDLISAGSAGQGRTTIRLGNGDGTFREATSYLMAASYYGSLALGDINGDGILDLLSSGGTQIAARLGNGDGTFGNVTTYSMPNSSINQVYGIVLGDLNGDGVLDIAAGVYNDNTYDNDAVILLGKTQDGSSPLLPFELATLSGARQALPVFDQKIQELAKQRGQIGAFQSRVQVGINNLQSASENYASAESRIRDVDIAIESSELLRLNILQQAASSVLAQANQQPALALSLLRNLPV